MACLLPLNHCTSCWLMLSMLCKRPRSSQKIIEFNSRILEGDAKLSQSRNPSNKFDGPDTTASPRGQTGMTELLIIQWDMDCIITMCSQTAALWMITVTYEGPCSCMGSLSVLDWRLLTLSPCWRPQTPAHKCYLHLLFCCTLVLVSCSGNTSWCTHFSTKTNWHKFS